MAVIRLAAALPGERERLAREAAGDEIDAPEEGSVERGDFLVARDAGPVPREDGAAERVSLAEGNSPEPSLLGGEIKSADAGEEGEMKGVP